MKRPAAGPWMVEYICSDQAAAGRHYAGCGWFTITHCLRRVRLVSGHIARIVRIARSSGGEDSHCEQASVARIVEAGCPLAQTLESASRTFDFFFKQCEEVQYHMYQGHAQFTHTHKISINTITQTQALTIAHTQCVFHVSYSTYIHNTYILFALICFETIYIFARLVFLKKL